ncbi:glycosyltransferase family 4 protein [soil metagenome]
MSGSLWMLSRKHPPSVGGMQQLSWHLVQGLSRQRPVTAITWGRGSRGRGSWGLPLFFAWAQLRLAWGLARGRIAVLHLGDPSLAALAWLPRLAGVPVFATVHGLDITYPARWYQAYLAHFFWGRMRAYACISRHVQSLVLARGIAAQDAPVIPVGIDVAAFLAHAPESITRHDDCSADDCAEGITDRSDDGPTLLCLGRLVERKGVAWFLESVAPRWLVLHPRGRLKIAGDGPLRERIMALSRSRGMDGRIEVLGEVDEPGKRRLLAEADLLLMPNIRVPGDAEGFGLVCLEAGASATWVLAADIEGLRDAIIEGENGNRVPSGDPIAWSRALDNLCADRDRLRSLGSSARSAVDLHFGWPAIVASYAALSDSLAAGCVGSSTHA